MISLFRRHTGAASPVSDAAPSPRQAGGKTTPEAPRENDGLSHSSKKMTAGKGRPTPKRRDSQKHRPVTSAPQTNKEARTRMRERMKAERAERYEGMRRGDPEHLLPRDRGPVRGFVRDLVDARRNIGPWFFGGTFVVVICSLGFMPPIVRSVSTLAWLLLMLFMIIDALLITLRIKREVRSRFPESDERPVSLCFYGVMRSVVFRKLRNPKPKVHVGDEL